MAMSIDVAYPFSRLTLEPRPLRATQIWTVAEQVREQVFPGRKAPRLEMARLTEAARRIRVNGTMLVTHWDLQRRVCDEEGREALGVTEADPALPGALVISLNAAMIGERDYLTRSTLAHELGHAVFDGPSMTRRTSRVAFAMVTPDEGHLTAVPRVGDGLDWREYRANEFMGALLAPRPLLHREMVNRAVALGLPLVDAGQDLPALRAGAGFERIEHLLLDLAERFGVSAEFIECRMRRYALVR